MEPPVSPERLREILLDLQNAQQRERGQRVQFEGLLAGVRALAEAQNPDELFERMFAALRGPLEFEAAFVLRPSGDTTKLVAAAATEPALSDTVWTPGKAFERVLRRKRIVIHIDTRALPEWRAQPAEVQALAASAMVVPLERNEETALLICTSRAKSGFTPLHREIAQRFKPLANQALHAAQRAAEIERTNREMRLVLDSVQQGLAMLDREQRVVGEMSAQMTRWFPELAPGISLPEILGPIDATFAAWFDEAYQQLVAGVIPMEVALDVMPKRLHHAGRMLGFALRPVGDEGSWQRMMLVVSDISDLLERERAEEHRRELAALVRFAVRDTGGFSAFIEETRTVVRKMSAGMARDEQLRTLHTIKGNASVTGLESVARMAHDMEERLVMDVLSPRACAALETRIDEIAAEMAPLLTKQQHALVIDEADLSWLLKSLTQRRPADEILAGVARWRLERASSLLERAARQARGIAARLGKDHVKVSVEHDDARVDADTYRPFFSALVHAVRNAVDHGIEPAEERVALGKPREANIRLSAFRREGALIVSVVDDGAGVNWDEVAARAQSLGLPHADQHDLVNALYAAGLSTCDAVHEVSGRGIGLNSLKSVVEALGGDIHITSTPREGTSVEFRFEG